MIRGLLVLAFFLMGLMAGVTIWSISPTLFALIVLFAWGGYLWDKGWANKFWKQKEYRE